MTGVRGLEIGVHFDLICPWCFIGKRQLAIALDQFVLESPRVPVRTRWRPVQLLPDVPDEGLPFAPFYEQRLGSAEAVRLRREQVLRAARSVDLALDLTAIARLPNTARVHRLLRRVAALNEPALYDTLLEGLFAAYFQRGLDIGDAATLERLAAEAGAPEGLVDDVHPVAWTSPGVAAPIAGVPNFDFNGRLSLSGARAPEDLLEAMRQIAQAPALALA